MKTLQEIVENSIALSPMVRKELQQDLQNDVVLGTLNNCNFLSKFLIGEYEITKEESCYSLYKNLYNGYEITTIINDNFGYKNYTAFVCLGYAPNYLLGCKPCDLDGFIDGIKYIKIKHVNHRNFWWKLRFVNLVVLYLHFVSFLFVTLHLDNEEFMHKFTRFDQRVSRFKDNLADKICKFFRKLKPKKKEVVY